ncbi:MAG TPA: hypothetical protein VMV37_15570, partial [Gammaproteobacteria bacterium]|nr:hypothetical protein [Gammaproteobacteria bacterium]
MSDTELSSAERARRRALASLARLAGAAATLPLVAGLASSTASAQTRAPGGPPPRAPQPGTRVVMLGTHGGPGIERDRAQTSSAVV